MPAPRPLRLVGLLLATLLVLAGAAQAQSLVRGVVTDGSSGATLPGVNIVATRLPADSTRRGTVTNLDGVFRLPLPTGAYRLRLSFVGYLPLERTVRIDAAPVDLGRLSLRVDTLRLGPTVVEGYRTRVEMRGDTTVYNADAYPVHPDASARNLVEKMPGITVQDGKVEAQGETVQRVLVDGEEFFGDDATVALNNLPAASVREIQVLDRQSDQARFTGFDDGNTERTINIVTRPGWQGGQFGRLFGGYGPESRYLTGGAVNRFTGPQRLSAIALVNNVNQQNFSNEDLLGVLSGGNGGGRGGRGGGGGARGNRGGRGGGGGGPRGGGGSDASNYQMGEVDGINATQAVGLNAIDRWGASTRFNGSYFFNHATNALDAALDRAYFSDVGDVPTYRETSTGTTGNANHRLNLRLESNLGEATQLTATPRLSVQSNHDDRQQVGLSQATDGTLLSRTATTNRSDRTGYNSRSTLLLRHRFAAPGRSLSMNVGLNLDGRDDDTDQSVDQLADAATGTTSAYQRQIAGDDGSRQISGNLAYTEPLGDGGQLQFTYAPGLTTRTADQFAFLLDPATGGFTTPDPTLTSTSDQQIVTQRAGLSYRHRMGSLSGSVGLDGQTERLTYDQTGNRTYRIDRTYRMLLPSANLRLRGASSSSVGLFYRASTSAPSVTQLRETVDNTNPLLVTTGNPDLRTSTTHRVDLRYRGTRADNTEVLTALINLSVDRDHIGTAVALAGTDSTVVRGVVLAPGAQLSYPVNLGGAWSARTFATYGRPLGWLRSNGNLSAGLSYAKVPSQIDEQTNRATAVQIDGRAVVGSAVSARFDANLGYGVTYTAVTGAATAAGDERYARHRPSLRVAWLPRPDVVLESDVQASFYTGVTTGTNPTVRVWNVGVGYKFLHDDLGELRLTVNDLLNQTRSVRRTATELYLETLQTQALGRYALLNFSYKLRP